ncbi:hypothetical protein NBRC10512v2_001226 [Rhodotorula toruloides]
MGGLCQVPDTLATRRSRRRMTGPFARTRTLLRKYRPMLPDTNRIPEFPEFIRNAPARPQLLRTSPESTLASSLETASKLLHDGNPVAFPTETVYGLGGSALSSTAVKRIFWAKGRPADNPLIVHISSREMLADLIPSQGKGDEQKPVIPPMYEALMDRFWPGPLSLIFPISTDRKGKAARIAGGQPLHPPRLAIADEVTAQQPSVCVRMPSHPIALSLIRQANLPLAAPSANLSTRPSPTSAAHVMADLGQGRGVGAVLDGGECEVGVESTVVDWVPPENDAAGGEGSLRVLRAGGVTAEQIEACLRVAGFGTAGEAGRIQVYARDFRSQELEKKPTTPGMKYMHYSPKNASVVLVTPAPGTSTPEQPVPSLQELVQLVAVTHGPGYELSDKFGEPPTLIPTRVGLMFTESTLDALKIEPFAAISPACSRVRIPPPAKTFLPTQSANLDDGLPKLDEIEIVSYPLGSRDRPIEAAQRLFAGLRFLDSFRAPRMKQDGVHVIFVEAIPEEGVGLAVMERAKKAAGVSEAMPFEVSVQE